MTNISLSILEIEFSRILIFTNIIIDFFEENENYIAKEFRAEEKLGKWNEVIEKKCKGYLKIYWTVVIVNSIRKN